MTGADEPCRDHWIKEFALMASVVVGAAGKTYRARGSRHYPRCPTPPNAEAPSHRHRDRQSE
jgi:hypothetical protein